MTSEQQPPNWKAIEEERWANYETKDEPRLQSLEQLAVIAVFLAGFALSDLSSFDNKDFRHPAWSVIYLTLMSNVAGCSAFLAIVGVLTISTVHREADWDKSLSAYVRDSQARSFREARAQLFACPTYTLAVRQLHRLARFNSQGRTRYAMAGDDLGIPFSTRTLHIMGDFNSTPIGALLGGRQTSCRPGFARARFPGALFCYFVAVCIKYLQTVTTYAVIIAPASLLTWGFFMAYYR